MMGATPLIDLHPFGAMGLSEICDGGIYHILPLYVRGIKFYHFKRLAYWRRPSLILAVSQFNVI